MLQSIIVTPDKLKTIPDQTAPQCIDQKITELRQEVLESEILPNETTSLKSKITGLEEVLHDGEIYCLSTLFKTALVALAVYHIVSAGSKQVSRGDGVSKLVAWSGIRFTTYLAVYSAFNVAQKAYSTGKSIKEIFSGDPKNSSASNLLTALFPLISRRLNGYDKIAINREITSLNSELQKTINENQTNTDNLKSQLKKTLELKENFSTLFRSNLEKHDLFSRYSGRLDYIFNGSTMDGEQLPINSDDDWNRALNSYERHEPAFRVVDGVKITKLEKGEIDSLRIQNIRAVFEKIETANLLFNAFAKYHKTSIDDLANSFATAFLNEIPNLENDIDAIKKIVQTKINDGFVLNVKGTDDPNLHHFTPAKPKAQSRLPNAKPEGKKEAKEQRGIPSVPSTNSAWLSSDEEEEEEIDYLIGHDEESSSAEAVSLESAACPKPDQKLFSAHVEDAPLDKNTYLKGLKTPNANKRAKFTEEKQTAAKAFIKRFVRDNPNFEARYALQLEQEITENKPGTPRRLNNFIDRVQKDETTTISMEVQYLEKE